MYQKGFKTVKVTEREERNSNCSLKYPEVKEPLPKEFSEGSGGVESISEPGSQGCTQGSVLARELLGEAKAALDSVHERYF